jgi:hypothetical protein
MWYRRASGSSAWWTWWGSRSNRARRPVERMRSCDPSWMDLFGSSVAGWPDSWWNPASVHLPEDFGGVGWRRTWLHGLSGATAGGMDVSATRRRTTAGAFAMRVREERDDRAEAKRCGKPVIQDVLPPCRHDTNAFASPGRYVSSIATSAAQTNTAAVIQSGGGRSLMLAMEIGRVGEPGRQVRCEALQIHSLGKRWQSGCSRLSSITRL